MAHLVTGKVRLSYEHIWEPASINDSDEKYSVSLIIPKSDTKTVKDIQIRRYSSSELCFAVLLCLFVTVILNVLMMRHIKTAIS